MLLSLLFSCTAMKEHAIESAMDKIWNQGDLSVIDAAYTPELASEVKRFVVENRALYPDIHISIDNVIVKDDWFVTQWTVSGTHRDLKRPVKLSGVSVRRYEGGKFVEETMVYDLKSVYDQLGFRVVPPAGVSPFDSVASIADAVVAPVVDTSLFPAASTGSVSVSATVAAPRAEVYKSWTTPEGWKAFFDVDSRIELRAGGPYEILFGPSELGEGNRGSEGCQVLAFVPDRAVAFSWSAPPDFPEERAQRTFVVVTLDDVPGGTSIRLDQGGFGSGAHWAEVQAYFEKAWGMVLKAEVDHFGVIPVPEKPKGKR